MHPSSERFIEIMQDLIALHTGKSQGYGRADDPFHNVRSSAEFGMPGWVGAVVRLNDKVTRLKVSAGRAVLASAAMPLMDDECDCGNCVRISQEADKTLPFEGIVDNLDDIAVYAVIARVLYEQENEPAYIVAPREDWPDLDNFSQQVQMIFKDFDAASARDPEVAE